MSTQSSDPGTTALPPAPLGDAATGAILDRYELGELLGSGGMARVYRGYDQHLHRHVAVKLLRETVAESDRARFRDEARTLAGLPHPNLVTVLDAGISAERPYIVMELVEGRTLAEVLALGPLSLPEAQSLGTQLAEALAFAHANGVVHRDVKPANVLLRPDGVVKLADFGIARLIGDTVGHTRTGATVGTAAYLSPEQVEGGPVTGAADVYALGLLLIEAVTGERVFPGPQTEAALARLHRDPVIPSGVPAPWVELLAAMVRRDPAGRPEAANVVDRLRSSAGSGATSQDATGGTGTRVLPKDGVPAHESPEPAASASPLDRAGDALAQRAGAAVRWARGLPEHQRGLAGALLLLALLLVAVALLSNDGGSRAERDLPAGTPDELVEPLQHLRTAVNGNDG